MKKNRWTKREREKGTKNVKDKSKKKKEPFQMLHRSWVG